MQTTLYTRKPLQVEAVQVTDDNIYEVAEWCGGDVYTAVNRKKTIQVKVLHPLHPKQSKAQAGDWVLKSEQGYKVYADSAFLKGFTKVDTETASDRLREHLGKMTSEMPDISHGVLQIPTRTVESVPPTEALQFKAPAPAMDTI